MLRFVLTFLALATLPFTAAASELPRRSSLGVQLAPGEGGEVIVGSVLPGLTGSQIGLLTGDVILKAGGDEIDHPRDIANYVTDLEAGKRVELQVRRNGQIISLSGYSIARPFESYENANVDYGAVPFEGGILRDILVMPKGEPEAPVVFLLSGFSCASIESMDPEDTNRELAAGLAAEGIGFYRVEKPGVGDSRGGANCADIDYPQELKAFRAAYDHLISDRNIDSSRIFMLGHSLGGITAPLLAAQRPPAGVAVYGTALQNWADYYQQAASIQSFIYAGSDPAKSFEEGERAREAIYRYFVQGQSPAEIVAEQPELEPQVRSVLGWEGGDRGYAGRHWRFLQSLANLPLVAAWRDTNAPVLSIYGENDVVALFNTDQKLIAQIANYYRPGSGRFVEVSKTDHDMRLLEMDRIGFRKHVAETGKAPTGPFNSEIVGLLSNWISESSEKTS